jgi:hypothetical protein
MALPELRGSEGGELSVSVSVSDSMLQHNLVLLQLRPECAEIQAAGPKKAIK